MISTRACVIPGLYLLLSTACGDDGAAPIDAAATDDGSRIIDAPIDGSGTQIDAKAGVDALPATCTPTAGTNLALELVASGLSSPVFATAPAGDPRLFVVEQPGRIRIVKDGALVSTPFLDITSVVRSGGERGLLGLAFHPDYATNGRFFVNYTARSPSGDTVIAEYGVSSDADVASDTETRLLTVAQPFSNHNGGMIAFSPNDGFLYIGMGDGGSGGDPEGHGQNNTSLLGAMLRIDVDTGSPFGIPVDNPFVNSPGADEIWATGLRNPWRFSFDRSNGDLYIADVGQGAREEVNVTAAPLAAGLNYGWNSMEGTICYPSGNSCDMSGKVLPVAEYSHAGGRCSITGGYVYRGTCLPDIQGWYFYGDYCTNEIWTISYANGTATEPQGQSALGGINSLSSFGQDASGELYVVALGGSVYKIVAAK